jgi:hypothetical protein
VVSNFVPEVIEVPPNVLPATSTDLVSSDAIDGHRPIELGPYGFAWIATDPA